jgi:hypothetical protein
MLKLFLQFLVAIPIAVVLVVGLLAFFALLLMVRNRIAIRMERPPISTVRQFFDEHYPNQSISWLRLAANETSRPVVGVFYGGSRPPRYKFFAVPHDSGDVVELNDCRKYAPKNWR